MSETIINIDTIFFFDMDGTLIDTDYANFLSYKKAIHSVINDELELSYNPHTRFNRCFLQKTVPNLTHTDYENIILRKDEYFGEFLFETKLNFEIAEILFKYSKTNKTFLVTNCREDRAFITLNHFGLTDIFDNIFFSQNSSNTQKTNKFSNAISQLGISPISVIAFENEEGEIAYAREAGIKFINPIL